MRDQAALITGGSRGLGKALGRELAARGARVVLVARHEAALREAVAELHDDIGVAGRVFGLVADVGDKHAVHRISAEATALVGPIDVLVHNASTLGPSPLSLLLDTDCEDFEDALRVNVLGAFRLSKALAGSMALRGGGTIVHVSSDAAVEAYSRWGAYGASKAALDHLSRTWAVELAPHGVRVLSVDPGEMDTELHRAADPEADRSALARPEHVAARIAELIANEAAALSGTRARISAHPSVTGAVV